MKKKLVSIFLSFAMVVTMMPAMASSVFADGETAITSIDLTDVQFGVNWGGTNRTSKENFSFTSDDFTKITGYIYDKNNERDYHYYVTGEKYMADFVLQASQGKLFEFSQKRDSEEYYWNETEISTSEQMRDVEIIALPCSSGGDNSSTYSTQQTSQYVRVQIIFTATANPIESLDFSECAIGEGWTGKTVAEAEGLVSNVTFEHCAFADQCHISNTDGSPISGLLLEGQEYKLEALLKANDTYYFPRKSDSDSSFNGTTIIPSATINIINVCGYNAAGYLAGGGGENYLILSLSFTVSSTPIKEIDLSSYDIGNGWAGKTSEEIANIFKGYNMCNCTYFDSIITDDEYTSVDTPLKEGTTYLFVLVLKANDNYCFNKKDEKNLDGEVILADKNKSIFNAAGVGTWDSQSRLVYVEGNKNVVISFNITPTSESKDKVPSIIKIGIVAAAVAAVAGVVGTVVKNLQKAVVAQQMAFQAKMQQQMVQKQVASIKTVLKGAGVVLSLASFGSSLGKLFQLNQFGFNPFGFR